MQTRSSAPKNRYNDYSEGEDLNLYNEDPYADEMIRELNLRIDTLIEDNDKLQESLNNAREEGNKIKVKSCLYVKTFKRFLGPMKRLIKFIQIDGEWFEIVKKINPQVASQARNELISGRFPMILDEIELLGQELIEAEKEIPELKKMDQ